MKVAPRQYKIYSSISVYCLLCSRPWWATTGFLLQRRFGAIHVGLHSCTFTSRAAAALFLPYVSLLAVVIYHTVAYGVEPSNCRTSRNKSCIVTCKHNNSIPSLYESRVHTHRPPQIPPPKKIKSGCSEASKFVHISDNFAIATWSQIYLRKATIGYRPYRRTENGVASCNIFCASVQYFIW